METQGQNVETPWRKNMEKHRKIKKHMEKLGAKRRNTMEKHRQSQKNTETHMEKNIHNTQKKTCKQHRRTMDK